MWLTKTVPTEAGWAVFWLREDPGYSNKARVWYAHVDFDGQLILQPRVVATTPKIAWRDRYYNVAWNGDHYGLITAENGVLYYQSLSWEGAASNRRPVGPGLFIDPVYDQEADSDFQAYPGGFFGVIEGDCGGHSCSYAFRTDQNGLQQGSSYNLVDFDYTHQFWPKAAFDGTGFVVVSVKDAVDIGGVTTKYVRVATWGEPDAYHKVVTNKDYLWDEYPQIAYNGSRFASVWTEVNTRPPSGPSSWRVRFGVFDRGWKTGSDVSNRVLDGTQYKSPFRWAKSVNAVGPDFVVNYSSWRQGDPPAQAIFEYLDGASQTHAHMEPFMLTADALASSVHFLPEYDRRLGVAHGSVVDGGTSVTFNVLDPPVCQQ